MSIGDDNAPVAEVIGYDPTRGRGGCLLVRTNGVDAWLPIGAIEDSIPRTKPRKRSPWVGPEHGHAPSVSESRVLVVRHIRGTGAPGDRCREVSTYYLAGEDGDWTFVENDSGPE